MKLRSPTAKALGCLLVLAGVGCASSDLSNNSEISGQVVECLPVDTPAPTVVARAIWYPNASGFGSTDASPLGHASGVLALAGDKLWFMTWNNPEHHFDMLHDIAVLTAAKISVAHLGPSAMLVVQSRNLSFDSFELMKKGHFSSDPDATQALYQKLQDLRSKNPQSDP
jgi:hypothetical protein